MTVIDLKSQAWDPYNMCYSCSLFLYIYILFIYLRHYLQDPLGTLDLKSQFGDLYLVDIGSILCTLEDSPRIHYYYWFKTKRSIASSIYRSVMEDLTGTLNSDYSQMDLNQPQIGSRLYIWDRAPARRYTDPLLQQSVF